MRVFLVFIIAIFSWHFGVSQNLPDAHKGTLMYRYYKIDYNQARRLHKKSTEHIDSFLTNLVLEVPNDSFGKILPQEPGNYILAWMQNTTVYYKSYNKPFLYIKTSGVLGEGQLKLYSFEGNLVQDATVKLNTKKKDWETIPFDPGCGCYSFDNKLNNKLISIEKEGAFEFYRISNEGLNIPSIDRSNPYAGTRTYPGYMVFNKPKYRHFDTLKLKTFVVSTDGKPLRRKLDVVLYANNESTILATIKPETPGAYVYDFVISDSLRLNSTITVALKYYNETIKQNSVIVEDYELKKASYSSRMLKNYFNLGEAVEAVVEAFDANKMPMLDTRVKLKLEYIGSNALYPESYVTHDTILAKLYSYNEMIDETGTSIIEIPKEVFLPMLATYKLTVDQINAEGEYQTRIYDFVYNAQPSYYTYGQVANKFYVNQYIDGENISGQNLQLKTFYQGQVLKNEMVKLPLEYTILPAVEQIELWNKDSLIGRHVVLDNATNYISIKGCRTHDSIKAELVNPFGLDVYYRIYQNKKIVYKGYGSSFSYAEKDVNMFPYYILYGYQWAGKEHFFEKQLVVQEKELKISLEMPKAIFPGESVDASITVTDYKNVPLSRVNLAAYSVSMEFDDIPVPDMPYFGRRFPQMSRFSNFYLREQTFSGNATGKQVFIEKLHVTDSNYYLQYMFPNKKTIMYSKKNEYEVPEFTPLVISEGKSQAIAAIWLNDHLIYSAINEQKTGLVLRYPKGVYTLKIRSMEHTIIVKNFELKEYERLFLSVDPYSNNANNTTITKETEINILSDNEMAVINGQTLYLESKYFFSDSVWIENNGIRMLIGNRYNSNDYKNHWYPEIQKYLLSITGIKPGKTIMRLNRDTFYFNFVPGYYYVLEEGILASYPLPYYPLNNEIITSNQLVSVESSFMAKPLYFKSDVRKMIQRKHENYVSKEQEKLWNEQLRYYNYQKAHKEKNGRLKIFNPANLNIAHFWLINNEEKLFSYASSGFRNVWDVYVKKGNYTAVLITHKGQVFIRKDIDIQKGSAYFLRLQKNRFKKLTFSDIEQYQQTIHEVSRPSILPANLFPELSVGNWTFKKDTSDYGSILGVIKDKYGLGELANVTVILEQNGYIKNAVITNAWGEFIFRNVQEGEYMLKLIANGYRHTTIHRVIVKNRNTALVNLYLERSSSYFQEISNPLQPANNFISSNANFGNGQINLKIIDAINGEALLGVTIGVYYKNEFKKGAATDAYGIAQVNGLEFGDYQIIISYVGFQQLKLNLTLSDNNKKYFEVALKESSMALNEVVIESDKLLIAESYGGSRSYVSEEIDRLPVRGATGVIATAGGVTSVDGSDLMIRGGRTEQVVTYVDGIVVRGSESLPSVSYNESTGSPTTYYNDIGNLKNDNILNNNLELLEGKTAPNRLRTNFRDYGYWVPNLVTDRNGKAYFKATFPDNITQWQNIIPAMDYHRNTGVFTSTTKAFLPYTAQLGIPRFLVKGDSVLLSGKVFNYTENSLKANASFLINNEQIFSAESDVTRQEVFNAPFVATNSDSIEVSFIIKNETGFKEGEKRSLKVFEDYIERAEVQTITLRGDTSFTIRQEQEETFGIIVFNDKRDFLKQQIELLKSYNYGCVEQTASKLYALLASKQLSNVIGKPFNDDKLVQKMIARLAKFQKINGSWGWWQNDATDNWITIYVTKVLAKAQNMGFNSFAYSRALKYTNRNLLVFNERLFLEATIMLSEAGQKTEDERFGKLIYENLGVIEKLLYLKIKMLQGQTEGIDNEVLKLVSKNYCGEIFWGQGHSVFYNDRSFATLVALEILKKMDSKPRMVKAVEKSVFSTACQYNYLNTLQRAMVIGYLLENLDQETGAEVAMGFKINGEKVIDFPKRYESKSNSIQLEYTGRIEALVFVFRNRKISNANTSGELYKINATFTQNGKETEVLKLGKDALMQVKIENRISANFIMIEIPIPAGCSYGNSELPRFGHEVYREYRRNKVVIYCKNLPAGTHDFSIALEPRFQGSYTVLPTKIEEMYFPDKNGNNAAKRIQIIE